MMNACRIVFMLGPPCAGKTTISKEFANSMNCHHVSSGDIAREVATQHQNVAHDLEKGDLADPDRMDDIMMRAIEDAANRYNMLVVDGYPRYMAQLVDIFHFIPAWKYVFVLVAAKTDVIQDRATFRSRSDDIHLRLRINTYLRETDPVLMWLKSRGMLLPLDNNGIIPIEDHITNLTDAVYAHG